MDKLFILKQLTDAMQVQQIDEPVIAAFIECWERLGPRDPVPCPFCFDGAIGPDTGTLKLQPREEGREAVACDTCGAIIDLGAAT
jgi:hypothetical protein